MVYGTMGGEGQPQTQAALFTRHVLFGQDLQAAVTAPRWLLGRTWGAEATNLRVESRFAPDVIDALRRPATMSRWWAPSIRSWDTPAPWSAIPRASSKAPPTPAATGRWRRSDAPPPYQPMALGSQVASDGYRNSKTSPISCMPTNGRTPT